MVACLTGFGLSGLVFDDVVFGAVGLAQAAGTPTFIEIAKPRPTKNVACQCDVERIALGVPDIGGTAPLVTILLVCFLRIAMPVISTPFRTSD